MPKDIVYLDASALVKLVLREKESMSLRAFLRSRPRRVTSVLAAIEVRRAVRRSSPVPADRERARKLFTGLTLLSLDGVVIAAAAELSPPALRSLDAVHIASALLLREELAAFVSYDSRQREAARASGLPVASP